MFPISFRGISFELTNKRLHVRKEVLLSKEIVSTATELKPRSSH